VTPMYRTAKGRWRLLVDPVVNRTDEAVMVLYVGGDLSRKRIDWQAAVRPDRGGFAADAAPPVQRAYRPGVDWRASAVVEREVVAMHVALTVRKLKPDTYDAWRKAWDPGDEWPEGSQKAYILRNLSDPNEIIAFGMFEGDMEALRNDPTFAEMQRRRFEAMAPHVESIGADGIYEVVEEITP